MGLSSRRRSVHVISGDGEHEYVRVHPQSVAQVPAIVPWHAEKDGSLLEEAKGIEWHGARMIWASYGWPVRAAKTSAQILKYFTLPRLATGITDCRCAVYIAGKLTGAQLNERDLLTPDGGPRDHRLWQPPPNSLRSALQEALKRDGLHCFRFSVDALPSDRPGLIFRLSVEYECLTWLGHLRERIRSWRGGDHAGQRKPRAGCWAEVRKRFLWPVAVTLAATAIAAAAVKWLGPLLRDWWASR